MVAVKRKTRRIAYVAVPKGDGPSPPAIFVPSEDAAPPRKGKRGAPSAGALLRAAVAIVKNYWSSGFAPTMVTATQKTRPAYVAVPTGDGPSPPAISAPDEDAAPPRNGKWGAPSAGALLRAAVAVAALLLLARVPVRMRHRGPGRGEELLAAVRADDDAKALRLVAAGADPNFKGNWGDSPLHHAGSNGQVDVVEALLAHGADPNAKELDGWTPLLSAIWNHASNNNCVEVVEALLAHGADPNAKNNYGSTPLPWASGNGRADVVKALLAHGANPNAKDKWGDSSLHHASSNGQVDVVEALIAHGADPKAKNRSGDTPLRVASRAGRVDVVEALLSHGAGPSTDQAKEGPRRV